MLQVEHTLSGVHLLAGSQIRAVAFCQKTSPRYGGTATPLSTTKPAKPSRAHQTWTLPGGLSQGPSTGWGAWGLGSPCPDCMLSTLVSAANTACLNSTADCLPGYATADFTLVASFSDVKSTVEQPLLHAFCST